MKGEESVYLFSKVTIELRNSKLCYRQRKRHRDQWSRRGSPETPTQTRTAEELKQAKWRNKSFLPQMRRKQTSFGGKNSAYIKHPLKLGHEPCKIQNCKSFRRKIESFGGSSTRQRSCTPEAQITKDNNCQTTLQQNLKHLLSKDLVKQTKSYRFGENIYKP